MTIKPELSIELRSMVRDVLREVLPDRILPSLNSAVERVRISSDQELAAFVARIIQPVTIEKLRRGELSFALVCEAGQGTSAPSGVLTGVITEQKISGIAKAGKLVLDANAVLTPLARDKARRLGLTIERRR